jgi:hypothetical protein
LNPEEVGKRQLIVTTLGEDFVKRLENAVPMKKYELMPMWPTMPFVPALGGHSPPEETFGQCPARPDARTIVRCRSGAAA